MRAEGRSLAAAARGHCERLNRLLNTTLTRARVTHAVFPSHPGVAGIRFGRDAGSGALLRSPRYGALYLQISQLVAADDAVGDGGLVAMLRYRYALASSLESDALIRWESSRSGEHGHSLWCRHHLQGTARLEFPRRTATLNEFHLPTGLVAIEDIVRFCIVDLGVRPLSCDWEAILQGASEGSDI
jgi:hypothetical protein